MFFTDSFWLLKTTALTGDLVHLTFYRGDIKHVQTENRSEMKD